MRGRFRRTKRLLFYGAVRVLTFLTLLPRRAALTLFAGIGWVLYWIDRPAVQRSLANLHVGFAGELSRAQARQIVRSMFAATGRNLVDLFRMSRLSGPELLSIVRFEGLEHLDRALAQGRGVVALSAHLGNWEILGAALSARGYDIHVVAREIFDRRSGRLLNRWRRRFGLTIHPKEVGLFSVVRALHQGGVVGTLVDQDTGGSHIFVDFFGRLAKTPLAPFVLAHRSGAALVPMWIHLDAGGVHHVTIRPALETSRGPDAQATYRSTIAGWHRVLEAAIRAHPEQWVWHHRRWRSRPLTKTAHLRRFSGESSYLVNSQRSRELVISR